MTERLTHTSAMAYERQSPVLNTHIHTHTHTPTPGFCWPLRAFRKAGVGKLTLAAKGAQELEDSQVFCLKVK